MIFDFRRFPRRACDDVSAFCIISSVRTCSQHFLFASKPWDVYIYTVILDMSMMVRAITWLNWNTLYVLHICNYHNPWARIPHWSQGTIHCFPRGGETTKHMCICIYSYIYIYIYNIHYMIYTLNNIQSIWYRKCTYMMHIWYICLIHIFDTHMIHLWWYKYDTYMIHIRDTYMIHIRDTYINIYTLKFMIIYIYRQTYRHTEI